MAELIFIDAKYKGEIELNKKAMDILKKKNVKSACLFSSIQFIKLEKVLNQMNELGISILTTKAKRTNQDIQILGCDAYLDSYKEDIISRADIIIYVGDGFFHPEALLLAQIKHEIKPVLTFNPISGAVNFIDKKDISLQIKKMKRNLRMYINSRKIGILVSIKPGQQYLNSARKLKEYLEKNSKKAYIFIDDAFDLSQLENFPFIEAWVNTACPRIAFDDSINTNKPIINLKEAFAPEKALEEILEK